MTADEKTVERVAQAIRDSMDSWTPMEGDYSAMARAAIAAMPERWQTIENCPSNGETVWIFGGRAKTPCESSADGDWWRYEAKGGNRYVPTHWMPFHLPAPPETDK